MRIIAITPSIRRSMAERFLNQTVSNLVNVNISCILVANSSAVAGLSDLPNVRVVRPYENLGFGRSVDFALDTLEDELRHWDWLLIVNDDVEINANVAHEISNSLIGFPFEDPEVVLFDPESPRRIPSKRDVFLDVSLLASVRKKLCRRRSGSSYVQKSSQDFAVYRLPEDKYKSFSVVGISRRTWELVGPLSERLPFTYEDAEYVLRYAQVFGQGVISCPLQINHASSSSSRSTIEYTLPVAIKSAYEYMLIRGSQRVSARGILLIALILRLVSLLMSKANRTKHARGCLRAFKLLIRGSAYELAPYDSTGGS